MNGATPHGTGTKSFQDPFVSLKWQVGIMNSNGKYLTAEPFNFKLNVSGSLLKKRQIWILVPDPQEDFVYLKSHLGRFLSSDKNGVVFCESESPGLEERFQIEYCQTGSGKWAFKHSEYGLYLSGADDHLRCFSKTPLWWGIQLAVHPQVHVKNLNRQRYAHLQDDEIHGTKTIPWTHESLITLECRSGLVAVRTCDGRYLKFDGSLVNEPSSETNYQLTVKCGVNPGLAFRDANGRYLTFIGANGTMKTRNKTAGKDELFVLEDSYAQVAVKAFNGKYASVRQGVDLAANQAEIEDKETFQLEFQPQNAKWRLRTCEDRLWSIAEASSGIRGVGEGTNKNTLFEMENHGKGRVSLKANNGLYVNSRKLGALGATSETAGEEEMFQLVILNRPIMVFRSEYGFIGTRSNRVDCNMVNYTTYKVESQPNGFYHLKAGETYWQVDSDNSISTNGTEPSDFIFEFHNRTHLAILTSNGKYLRSEQNGTVRADADEVIPACLWEY